MSSKLRRDEIDTLRDKFRLGIIGEDGGEVVQRVSIARVEVRASSSQGVMLQELKINGHDGAEVPLEEVWTEGHGGRGGERKRTGQQQEKVETEICEPVGDAATRRKMSMVSPPKTTRPQEERRCQMGE